MSKTRLESIIIDYGIIQKNYNGQEILWRRNTMDKKVCKIQVGYII